MDEIWYWKVVIMAKKRLSRQEQLDAIYMELVNLHEQQGCFDDETNLKIEQKILDLNVDRLILEKDNDFNKMLLESADV